MANLHQLLLSLCYTAVAYGVYRVLKLVYEEFTSPLRSLKGPKSSSFIYGHFKEIWKADPSVVQDKWVEQYGPTLKYKGFFGKTRLYTTDTKAIHHVLMNNYIYQKPPAGKFTLSRIVGSGLIVVEGDKHKQQRKVMNPAFGPVQLRELTEIFVAKSIQLRDIWLADSEKKGGISHVNALSWLSRMTLDVIGLAGFNYDFDALNDDLQQNELSVALSRIFHSSSNSTNLIPMLRARIPFLRFLREAKHAEIAKSHKVMARIGNELLRESKASIQDKRTARDLLSLMVKSNMATDIPEHQRMTDQDVLNQVPTFLVAGHETTSTGTTWALYALAVNKAVQEKLRQELSTVDTDNPTMDELNTLSYLDMVVRETMRVHAPIPSTLRQAVRDDVLPFGKPFTDRHGVVRDSIKVRKGQTISIPILALNCDKTIWGEDAKEFRPERWENVPQAAGTIPGVWSNLLTFLGGPRACIGYRFSIVETKALLFTLVRAFEFELGVPAKDIGRRHTIVQRPTVVTDPDGGNQMPLVITPVVRS